MRIPFLVLLAALTPSLALAQAPLYIDPTAVNVEIAPPAIAAGGTVSICVTARSSGFLSVWNDGTSGRVSRVFPSDGTAAQWTAAQQRVCLGSPGAGVTVSGPAGTERILAVWSADPAGQPGPPAFPTRDAWTAALSALQQANMGRWAVNLGQFSVTSGAAASLVPALPTADAAASVAVAVTPPTPRIGQPVRICARPAAAGFVSLWNVGSSGRVARIFPANSAAVPAQAGAEVCAGDLVQGGPAGQEMIKAVFTRGPAGQPFEPGFASVQQFDAILAGLGAEAATLAYTVVDGAAPAMAGAPPASGPPGGLFSEEVALDALTPEQRAELEVLRSDVGVRAIRLVRDGSAQQDRAFGAAAFGANVSLMLMPGVTVTANGGANATRDAAAGEGVWQGDIGSGSGGGEALLLSEDDGLRGRVAVADRSFVIRPLGGSIHAIVEVAPEQLPPDHAPGYQQLTATERSLSPDALSAMEQTRAMGPARIDILVAYGAETARRRPRIERDVKQWIAETNHIFGNSQINAKVNLVGLVPADYREVSAERDIDRLAANGDGYMDKLHAIRDQRRADIVMFVGEYRSDCGIAKAILAGPDTAFAVVAYDCAMKKYTFTHELGHLLGARHDWDKTQHPFTYGRGYKAAGWGTVMAYVNDRVPCFSSPRVQIRGQAAGTAEHDNARAVDFFARYVEHFR